MLRRALYVATIIAANSLASGCGGKTTPSPSTATTASPDAGVGSSPTSTHGSAAASPAPSPSPTPAPVPASASASVSSPTAGTGGTAVVLPLLHASGRSIVDSNGNEITLHGVNLGGWFIMEKWMTPLDSGSLADTYSVMSALDQRFGVDVERSLMNTYQTHWITTSDLDNIRNAGFNVVRVPVWWGQFYALGDVSTHGWRADAFDELDWLVSNAGPRGLYVILDLHGAVGGQSNSDATGWAGQNQYWYNTEDQQSTEYLWTQLASHYAGNPVIAGYDLLNEPDGAPDSGDVIAAYDTLYKAVRAVDPAHMIMLEGTWGNWNWGMLPDPSSHGWSNVVYEMHEYQYNGSVQQVEAGATNQVQDFAAHQSYGVPGYIGEFNCFNGLDAWQFSIGAYTAAGLNWTFWSYKATHGLVPDSWGLYDPAAWLTTPNIAKDSAEEIAAAWQEWTTTAGFTLNRALGIP